MRIVDTNPKGKQSILLIKGAVLRTFLQDLLEFGDLINNSSDFFGTGFHYACIHCCTVVCKVVGQRGLLVVHVCEVDGPVGPTSKFAIDR